MQFVKLTDDCIDCNFSVMQYYDVTEIKNVILFFKKYFNLSKHSLKSVFFGDERKEPIVTDKPTFTCHILPIAACSHFLVQTKGHGF